MVNFQGVVMSHHAHLRLQLDLQALQDALEVSEFGFGCLHGLYVGCNFLFDWFCLLEKEKENLTLHG